MIINNASSFDLLCWVQCFTLHARFRARGARCLFYWNAPQVLPVSSAHFKLCCVGILLLYLNSDLFSGLVGFFFFWQIKVAFAFWRNKSFENVIYTLFQGNIFTVNSLHSPHELKVLSEYFNIRSLSMPTYKLQTSILIIIVSREIKNNRHAQSIKAKSDSIFSFFWVIVVVVVHKRWAELISWIPLFCFDNLILTLLVYTPCW